MNGISVQVCQVYGCARCARPAVQTRLVVLAAGCQVHVPLCAGCAQAACDHAELAALVGVSR